MTARYLAVDWSGSTHVAHPIYKLIERRHFDAAVQRVDMTNALRQHRLVAERTLRQIGHE